MTMSPLILRYEHWPELDQIAWDGLFSTGSLFDTGVYTHWVEGGRAKRMQGYGRWLSFVLGQEPALVSARPSDRLTPERIEAFVTAELARCKPITAICRIEDVLTVAKGVDKDRDWSWLENVWSRLYARYGRTDLKPRVPLSAARIFDWARRQMRKVHDQPHGTPLQKAAAYRDALMVGMLIARPVRARAFIGIRIGTQLRESPSGFQLVFGESDMKDKRPHSYDLPVKLIEPLRLYLDIHRPILLRGKAEDHLWITRYGKAMTRQGWTRALPGQTQRHFGIALRPHAFRHIAATSIATHDPEHYQIIREVLGHSSLAMSEKHYNRASSLESCGRFHSVLAEIRVNAQHFDKRKSRKR